MRVLYITNDSGLSWSTIALKNLFSYLIPKGVEPFCVCRNEGNFTEWCLNNKIPYCVFHYNWNYQPPRNTIYDKLAYYWRIHKYYQEERRCMAELEKVCKEFHPDIIHTNNGIIHWGYKFAKKWSETCMAFERIPGQGFWHDSNSFDERILQDGSR